jgi:transposase
MNLKEKQYLEIAKLLPKQRGNVKINNRPLLAALIYRCENGCTWRALPQSFGPRHVIYVRLNRWAKSGVLERVYAALTAGGLKGVKVLALDSTAIKVHPDAHGAEKKRQTGGRQEPGRLEHEDSRGYGRRRSGCRLSFDRRERSGRASRPAPAGNSRETRNHG